MGFTLRVKHTALLLVAAGALCMLVFGNGALSSNNMRLPSSTTNDVRDTRMPLRMSEEQLPADSIYRLKAKDIDGNVIDLKQFVGKPAIVANVASL